QIKVDCDVILADGGTRTASITGAFVALHLACQKLLKTNAIAVNPITKHVVAVSCGIVGGASLLDLDYSEDSVADVDSNFIMSDDMIIEIQMCGERRPFTESELDGILALARKGRDELLDKQKLSIGG
ncbi:MAG: ribonuclease PH, partial [Holosporales bacterium]|nr:ribonuclease PH [Holosporales bacterium]